MLDKLIDFQLGVQELILQDHFNRINQLGTSMKSEMSEPWLAVRILGYSLNYYHVNATNIPRVQRELRRPHEPPQRMKRTLRLPHNPGEDRSYGFDRVGHIISLQCPHQLETPNSCSCIDRSHLFASSPTLAPPTALKPAQVWILNVPGNRQLCESSKELNHRFAVPTNNAGSFSTGRGFYLIGTWTS